MSWKSEEVPAAQSAGSSDVNTRSNPPGCLQFCTTSEQVGRTYDDSRLEDLIVPSIQGVELIRGGLSDGLSFSSKRMAFPLCLEHWKVCEKTRSEAGHYPCWTDS